MSLRESVVLSELNGSVIQGKVEDIELPVKHVDVIVSEWMVGLYKSQCGRADL